MSNYHRNFSNFPRHASLPFLPSRTHPNGQQNRQNIQPQIQNAAPYCIQQEEAQPIFEPLPDILAIPLDPTVRQATTQNIQERAQINNTHTIQDHTQHFFAPQQDEFIQFETNAQQHLQNIQPQYPTLSSIPFESRDEPLFKPMPDIPTSFNSNAQESARTAWAPKNIQQQDLIPGSINLQNYYVPTAAPLPDIPSSLQSIRNRGLPADTPSQTPIPQVSHQTKLLHNRNGQQFIRRTVSKPVIPTRKNSKTKTHSKKTIRGSAASKAKRAQCQLPQSMNSAQKSMEHTKNLKPQTPPEGLPSVMRNNVFKASLQSVLARSRKPVSASAPNRTQSILHPRFPDRAEVQATATPTARYLGRDQGKPNFAQGIGKDHGTPVVGMMPASGLVTQGMLPINQSTPDLQQPSNPRNSNPPGLTIRKRPASCSALPAKRISKEIAKKTRPCDSVDQAVAEGKELTKEQIRVLKNRQHAFNSRERTKSKRRQYDEENAMLRERIAHLENENGQLRTMRNALLETAPEHIRVQVQMMDNQKLENESHRN